MYYTSEQINERFTEEEKNTILSNASYDLNVSGNEALANYTLITESGKFDSNLKKFYSRYYWFCSFYEEYKSVNGNDAGLEQQLFQIIAESESLSEGVDWAVVKEMEDSITNKPD